MIHGPNFTGSYAILVFIASDFIFTTRHMHNFLFGSDSSFFLELWVIAHHSSPRVGALPTWGAHLPVSFGLFVLFMGVQRQEYWSGLLFPPPVDHILSELSTMTHPSWVALHGMAHNFIESHTPIATTRLWSMRKYTNCF